MEKTIVTAGKTIDLAIEAALTQLGLERDSGSVQVLQQAKTLSGIADRPYCKGRAYDPNRYGSKTTEE